MSIAFPSVDAEPVPTSPPGKPPFIPSGLVGTGGEHSPCPFCAFPLALILTECTNCGAPVRREGGL